MVMLPWDQRRVEEAARRADTLNVGRAATPYRRAGERLLGELSGRMAAANPTRGAAGTRSAALVAAPEMARLAAAGADATNAAQATAAANLAARERGYAEDAAQLFGLGLNSGGAVLGSLVSGLGGMGGLGGVAGAAGGTAIGGPLGGSLGGMLGSAAGNAVGGGPGADPRRPGGPLDPAGPPPAALLGGAGPGTRRDVPLGGYGPSTAGMYDSTGADPMSAWSTDPAATPDGVDRIPIAPRGGFATTVDPTGAVVPSPAPPTVPGSGAPLGSLVGLPGTEPGAAGMTDEEWRLANEEAMRLGRIGGWVR